MSDAENETVAPESVSRKDFLDLLRDYLENEVARVEQARYTGAGWEIWLQVELCVFVRREMTGDIIREQSYGGGSKGRADFVLNSHQPKGRTVVEIKTNVLGEGAYDLAKRVSDDFYKQLDAPKKTSTMVVGIWVGANPTKAIGGGEVVQVIEVVANRIYLLHFGAA